MFMVQLDTHFPADMDPEVKADLIAQEREYGQKLQRSGQVKYLWRVVGPRLCNVAIWDMTNEELNEWLNGLPMRPWIDVTVTPLAPHPSAIREF